MFQIIFIISIIFSAIIHEYSHAWAADELGDPTARNAGRLTLNPLAHIDWFGTIILPLLMIFTLGVAFGYAKPVPFNPYNLKNQKRDPGLVALAGPLSNFLLAIFLSLIIRFVPANPNFLNFLEIAVFANVLLLVFNLVPIPPLDGSKILFALLPDSEASVQIRTFLERYGYILLLFFIFFLFRLISPIIYWVYQLLIG
ncbi:site-2 protease family protein [Candidatus Parcubacteria bacterium]|nr:site-2 protease family protein [Patescibacteria group bacterium]MBU4481873.1 site-2 protease family protein [Patescibacteria group bacterium]MCG2686579.1 site-2 protease family protein [Candidatus Parcubacteria bacterium]